MAKTAASDGKAIKISSAVATISHVKIGIRHIVIPGARSKKTVTSRLIAVRIVEMLAIKRPMKQRSWPAPVPMKISESGA